MQKNRLKKYKIMVEKLEAVIEIEEGLTEEKRVQQIFDFISAELFWTYEEIREDEIQEKEI